MNKLLSAPHPNKIIHYGVLTLIYGVGVITLFAHTLLHATHAHSEHAPLTAPAAILSSCTGAPAHIYTVRVVPGGIEPSLVTAHRCDQIIIINTTDEEMQPALGPHEHHLAYPGFEEKDLAKGQEYSFRLYQTGTFPLHDHDNATLRATLTVAE